MRIVRINVKNFRSLKNVTIDLDKLTLLLGRNGSGKSSVLHAINIFYTLNARIRLDDYFNRNTKEPIEIELTFADFTLEEQETFDSHIDKGEMVVLKKISFDNEKTSEKYSSFMSQIPKFAEIRRIEGAKEKTAALKEVKNTMFNDLETPKSEAQTMQIMRNYEKAHPELLQRLEIEVSFLGARNVGGGSLDNFTKPIFLPAVREASQEVQGKGSSISQLLERVILQKIKTRDDLLAFNKDISQRIADQYSAKNLGGLEDISKSITETLSRYAPGSRLSLIWNPVQIPEVTLPSISTTVFEDEFGGDISNKGHGLQRAIILTLLEHLALTIASDAKVKKEETAHAEQKSIRIDTILLIEEPEIYQHPTRARYLSKVLFDLASMIAVDASSSRTQVIYTTHSPYFVGLDRFDNIRVCKKKKEKADEVALTQIIWNSLDNTAKQYEQICERAIQPANLKENFRTRTSNVFNTIMNESFFADYVILVEGLSDVGLLWKLQEIMNKNWERKAVSLIPVDGKENIIRIKIILDGLKIYNYIVYDKEVENPKSNKRLLKSVGLTGEELPKEKIHSTWAYNDLKLEDEVEKALGKEKVEEIWKLVQDELSCTDRIRKNVDAMARFTELVYEKKLTLPHYESIVEKISEQINALAI